MPIKPLNSYNKLKQANTERYERILREKTNAAGEAQRRKSGDGILQEGNHDIETKEQMDLKIESIKADITEIQNDATIKEDEKEERIKKLRKRIVLIKQNYFSKLAVKDADDQKMFQFNQEFFEELKCRWVHSILKGSPEGAYKNEEEMQDEAYCVGDGTYCQNANSLINQDGKINTSSTVYDSIMKFTNNNSSEADEIAKEIHEIAAIICDKGKTKKFSKSRISQLSKAFSQNAGSNNRLRNKLATLEEKKRNEYREQQQQNRNTYFSGDARLHGKTYASPLPGRGTKKHLKDINAQIRTFDEEGEPLPNPKKFIQEYFKHLQAMELMNASGIVGLRTCGGKKDDESDLADNADFFIVLRDLQDACKAKLEKLEASGETLQQFDKNMSNIRSLSESNSGKLGLQEDNSFTDKYNKFVAHNNVKKLRNLEKQFPNDYSNTSSITSRLRISRNNNRLNNENQSLIEDEEEEEEETEKEMGGGSRRRRSRKNKKGGARGRRSRRGRRGRGKRCNGSKKFGGCTVTRRRGRGRGRSKR